MEGFTQGKRKRNYLRKNFPDILMIMKRKKRG